MDSGGVWRHNPGMLAKLAAGLVAAVVLTLMAKSLLAHRPKLFSATLAELDKDRAALSQVGSVVEHVDR